MALIASALLDPLCERVINVALEEYRLVRDVEEEVKKLRSTVALIKGVLRDAEEKRVTEEAVNIWLAALKHILFDADDVLDEAATCAALQTREVGVTRSVTGVRAKVRNIFCCFGGIDKIVSGHDMAHQIKAIRMKLDDICKERESLGLRVLGGNSWPVDGRSRRLDSSSLLADVSYVIGRDDEKRKIIQLLLASGEMLEPRSCEVNVHILAIVGMGGIGKTTLTKLVFNDPTIKQYFQLMMWVCVSEGFDLKRIIKEIMDALNEKAELFDILNWDSTQRRLKEKLEGKRFLLVLDDVWEEEESKWESLFEPLKYGGKGSKIIITTRSQKASNAVKGTPILLKSLSSEGLWPIFKRYAFDSCDSSRYTQLETIGRQIVERLKGSPLAAKTIGRLLNERLDVKHWKNILRCDICMLQQHPNDILPILKLSYDHLPGHLKQCFAYCSLFPKDHKFFKDELVHLWMAQHLIQVTGNLHVESVGSEHFDDLLYMSFFEQSKNMQYVMHDLIHDLAESASMDDCFRLGDYKWKEMSETIRHVSIVTNIFNLTKLKELCKHGNLRSVLFLRRCTFDLSPHLDDLFMKLKRLRVLGLRRCKVNVLPTSIGTLRHLRLVDLSETHISKLPESFCSLYNLQVLKLRGCRFLSALPSNMSALICLRHLEADDGLVSDIEGLSKLTALQELGVSGRKVRELTDMSMLKELRTRGLEEIRSKEEAMQARLNVKEHLDVLDLGWTHNRDDHLVNQTLEEDVLEGLQPIDDIRQLFIRHYGGVKSPSWMDNPSWVSSSFLERVELKYCKNWEVLPPLGLLPCLKILKIRGMRKVRQIGPQFYSCSAVGGVKAQGFPLLEDLQLSYMPGLEEWEIDDQHQLETQQQLVLFPCLRKLEILNCPNLKVLPLLPPTLTRLRICNVGLAHLPRWLRRLSEGSNFDETLSQSSSPSLSCLSIEYCLNLRSLCDGLLENPLWNLENLEISGCRELVFLPEKAFKHLASLKSLKIRDCPKLTCPLSLCEKDALFCSTEEVQIHGCSGMEDLLLASLWKLTSLSKLDIGVGSVSMAVLLLHKILQHRHLISTLTTLKIRQTGSSFTTTNPSLLPLLHPVPLAEEWGTRFRELTSLTSLEIHGCSDLLQNSLPSSLEKLSINEDSYLNETILSACLGDLTSLKSLSICNCPAITTLPPTEVVCHLITLKALEISNCKELASLWDSHALASIEYLDVGDCPKLVHFVKEETSPSLPPLSSSLSQITGMVTSIKSLGIWKSSPQQMTVWLLQCPYLQSLEIDSCPLLTCFDNGDDDVIGKELETALLNLASSLRSLKLCRCKNLHFLPSKLRFLSSLQVLWISMCFNIQSLPVMGLPESLEVLRINGCPTLKERCREEGGTDWLLVSHIPKVFIR